MHVRRHSLRRPASQNPRSKCPMLSSFTEHLRDSEKAKKRHSFTAFRPALSARSPFQSSPFDRRFWHFLQRCPHARLAYGSPCLEHVGEEHENGAAAHAATAAEAEEAEEAEMKTVGLCKTVEQKAALEERSWPPFRRDVCGGTLERTWLGFRRTGGAVYGWHHLLGSIRTPSERASASLQEDMLAKHAKTSMV